MKIKLIESVFKRLLLEVKQKEFSDILDADDRVFYEENKDKLICFKDQNFLKVIINHIEDIPSEFGRFFDLEKEITENNLYEKYYNLVGKNFFNKGRSRKISQFDISVILSVDSSTVSDIKRALDLKNGLIDNKYLNKIVRDKRKEDFIFIGENKYWAVYYPVSALGSIAIARSYWNGELKYDMTFEGGSGLTAESQVGIGKNCGEMDWCTAWGDDSVNRFEEYRRISPGYMFYCITKTEKASSPFRKVCLGFDYGVGGVPQINYTQITVNANNEKLKEREFNALFDNQILNKIYEFLDSKKEIHEKNYLKYENSYGKYVINEKVKNYILNDENQANLVKYCNILTNLLQVLDKHEETKEEKEEIIKNILMLDEENSFMVLALLTKHTDYVESLIEIFNQSKNIYDRLLISSIYEELLKKNNLPLSVLEGIIESRLGIYFKDKIEKHPNYQR